MLPREYAENEVCGIFPVPIPEPIPNNKRKDRKKPADVLYWTEDRRRERESARSEEHTSELQSQR